VARHPASETTWGGPYAALAAILAGAAALRLVGVGYGLPFALLNPDEESVVPRAWKMVHGGGADPHWFDHPTLLLYLLAPFQAWQAHPSLLAARLVAVALGLGAVAASWWLGRAAYGALAGGVAAAFVAVETTHVAYSRMAVTDVPLTLGIAASLALMVSGRLELAGVAAGLAAGTKYPGVLLLVPLAVAAWGRWLRLAAAVVLAAAAFLASSPYVVAHPGEAAGDAWRVERFALHGALGFEHDHWAGIAFAARLWHGAGPAAFVAAAGLGVAAVRRRRADLVLLSFVVVYAADLLTLRAHFDRYTLPLVPPLGALGGRMRSLAPVTLLLLVVPLVWSIRDDRLLTRTDTRVTARSWIERNLPRGAGVAADPGTAPLPGFRVLRLRLPGPRRSFDENRDLDRLRALGIAYVVVTGAVADPVKRARDRYPRESRFYASLRIEAQRVYGVAADGRLAGPWVRVYHLLR